MPSPEALATALRMGLEVRRLRTMAVPISVKEDFAEIEALILPLSSLRHIGGSQAFSGKAGKAVLLLSDNEKSQLTQLHEALLVGANPSEDLMAFFGGQGTGGFLYSSSEWVVRRMLISSFFWRC